MERKEAIHSAYHMTGSNSFYDGMMTCSTLPGRAVCRLVWDMNRQDCVRYQEKAVSGIPEDFAGRLLEVPVGTGILTMPLYRTLPRAEITCLDYSPDMMAQAQEKARRMHLGNVAFRQGDVGALPFESGSFDAVLSLNGFHAFPDKEAAYRAVFRVLRPGGVFWDRVACVYDVFANVINRKANRALCAAVEPWIEPGDEVLECACGTGLLSGVIAQRRGAGADRPVSGAGRGGVVYLRLCAHGAARRHAPCDERTRRGLYRLQAPRRKNRRAGGACAAAGTA